jgi:hypothetical protein
MAAERGGVSSKGLYRLGLGSEAVVMQVSMIEVIPISLVVLLWDKWFVLWREWSWI